MAKKKEHRYYAVPEPDNPKQMTYWRWAPGSLSPWPEKARYGPWATCGDHPPFHTAEYTTWARALARGLDRYHAAIKAAIEADPVAAGKRFADFAMRCCICSKTLTDNLSKTYGICPDCRSGISEETLARYLTPQVGRVHAAEQARRRLTNRPELRP